MPKGYPCEQNGASCLLKPEGLPARPSSGIPCVHFVAAILSAPVHHCLTYLVMGGTSARFAVGQVSLLGHRADALLT